LGPWDIRKRGQAFDDLGGSHQVIRLGMLKIPFDSAILFKGREFGDIKFGLSDLDQRQANVDEGPPALRDRFVDRVLSSGSIPSYCGADVKR
jgi:hypothetical protein